MQQALPQVVAGRAGGPPEGGEEHEEPPDVRPSVLVTGRVPVDQLGEQRGGLVRDAGSRERVAGEKPVDVDRLGGDRRERGVEARQP
ncbi:hypothetical protein [Catenuloplanes japonicus]|uniref:hypothetical protein n=1 Tax=Catenuloplanes japonicus TaxID=33876 RepID=UPI0005254A66|nr:hypothetical protein [Catenuloplanes japonicus]